MARAKTKRQVAFLFSKGSPLNQGEKDKLASEISSGEVRVGKRKRALKRSAHKSSHKKVAGSTYA